MSANIIRITGTTDFPLAATELLFTDAEVDDVTLVPFKNQVQSFSQEDDLTIYNVGPEHWVIAVTFIVDTYNSLLKFTELRDHDAPLLIYPSYRDDPTRVFEVLWTDPNNFQEKLKRGFQQLGYAFIATFREPLGEVCRPPTVVS